MVMPLSYYLVYSWLRKSVHMNLIVSLIRLIKYFSKSYHYLTLKENRSLFSLLIICLISHFISFIERHVFIVKACLLFIKKFVTIWCLIFYFNKYIVVVGQWFV
jgi:hypothetical protein